MLKISEGPPGKKSITLRLEGRVVGPWVGELAQICELLINDGRRLVLELSEVSFADNKGVVLLAGLRSRGAKLLNATPFVAEQLKSPTIN